MYGQQFVSVHQLVIQKAIVLWLRSLGYIFAALKKSYVKSLRKSPSVRVQYLTTLAI